MFHEDFWIWSYLEYLCFLAIPVVVYITSVNNLEGAILPRLLSIGLLLKYWSQVKDQQIILGFLFFAVTMSLFMQYWGVTGLHLFIGGLVIWPILVLLLEGCFPWLLSYPTDFCRHLIAQFIYGMTDDWSGG